MSAAFPLRVQELLPIPLRDRIEARQSQLWQQDLTWNKQEHIFIQAPSGTGKTTLIHMLYGLRRDFEGQISWDRATIKDMDAERLSIMRRQQVSVIFQDMRLFPSLTAFENLEIKRVLTNTVTEAEVHNMLDRLGIADRANRPAATLSYGEQQRVAIIRALLQPFSWLLMDEPFSHLDAANTSRAAKLIEEVVAQNNASFVLAELDDNKYFTYTQKLRL